MLNQDNWPGFFKEASDFLTNYGFKVDEKTMALILGRTDQNTFVLLTQFWGNLTEQCDEAKNEELNFHLGDFGKLFLQNIANYPHGYQYIFFIIHQTSKKEVFEKSLSLGCLLMQYIDFQVQQAGVNTKNEKELISFINGVINSIAISTFYELKTNSNFQEVLTGLTPDKLLTILMEKLQSDLTLFQNQKTQAGAPVLSKRDQIILQLQDVYRSRNIEISDQFIQEISEYELYATTLLFNVAFGFNYESTEEDSLLSIFLSRMGEAGLIAENVLYTETLPQFRLYTCALEDNILEELWYFGYLSSNVAKLRFPDQKNITVGNVQKKLRKLAKVLPEEWADKHEWFDDGKLLEYVKNLTLKSFLEDFNGLLYEQWQELLNEHQEK